MSNASRMTEARKMSEGRRMSEASKMSSEQTWVWLELSSFGLGQVLPEFLGHIKHFLVKFLDFV